MGLWDSIKNKWNQMTGNAPVDHVSEQRRRRKLRESINDPDDLFFDDEVLDREELERVARKRRNRNSFRRGYYIFGAILGTAMIVIAVYNMLSTPKPDLQVLLQEDGLIEQGDIEDIQAFLERYVEDQNGDGKITVTFTRVSMPAERTEENENLFDIADRDIDEQLVPYNIAFFVGREEFIAMADELRGLAYYKPAESLYPLTETDIPIGANSPLNDYYFAVRAQSDSSIDKYSEPALQVLQRIAG